MPIIRITGSKINDEGRQVGEAKVEDVIIDTVVKQEGERQEALLAEAQRNREVANYLSLSRSPTREPLTAQEADMAEQKRTVVRTSGDRFDEIRQAQEEKLKVENVETVNSGIAKMATGAEQRLVPTAEVYAKEQGERSEGIPLEEQSPLAIARTTATGVHGVTTLDRAEQKLQPQKLGDQYSPQHATSNSSPDTSAKAQAEGTLDEVGQVKSDEDLKAQEEKGHEDAAKATQQDSGDGDQPRSDGNFSGSAEELESGYTADDLRAEAERRGLTVNRADGKEGAPLKSDYAKALASK